MMTTGRAATYGRGVPAASWDDEAADAVGMQEISKVGRLTSRMWRAPDGYRSYRKSPRVRAYDSYWLSRVFQSLKSVPGPWSRSHVFSEVLAKGASCFA